MKQFILFTLSVVIFSCSSTKIIEKKEASKKSAFNNIDLEQKMFRKQKALEYFTKGSVLKNEGKAAEALNEYYEAILYDPESITIYIEISEALMMLKRYDAAELNLKKALEFDPENIRVLENLNRALLVQNKLDDALTISELILKLNPANQSAFQIGLAIFERRQNKENLLEFIETHVNNIGFDDKMSYTIGIYYLSLNKLQKSREWFGKCLKINPNHINAKINLTRLDVAEGKKDKGLSDLKEIIKNNPDKLNALVELIEIYRQDEKSDEVIEIIESIENPDNITKLYLAEAYYKKENWKKAQELFSVVQLNRFNIYFEFLAGDTEIRLENYESGIAFFRSIMKRDPSSAQGYYGAAFSLMRQKNYLEAEEVLRVGLVKSNSNSLLQPMLAETLLNLNKDTEATRYLERMLKENPNDAATLMQVASSYQSAKMFDKSDALFEQAIEIDDSNVGALNNYSYSLSKRGIKLDYALTLIKKALQKEPNNGYYLDTMGWIYFKLKNYDLAKKFILKSTEVRGDDSSSEVLEHLGDVYIALKDTKNALIYYNKALSKNATSETLKKKISDLKK